MQILHHILCVLCGALPAWRERPFLCGAFELRLEDASLRGLTAPYDLDAARLSGTHSVYRQKIASNARHVRGRPCRGIRFLSVVASAVTAPREQWQKGRLHPCRACSVRACD